MPKKLQRAILLVSVLGIIGVGSWRAVKILNNQSANRFNNNEIQLDNLGEPVTLSGKLEHPDGTVYLFTQDDQSASRFFVVNLLSPEIQTIANSFLDKTVSIKGRINPPGSSNLYLISIDGQEVVSSKSTVTLPTPPTLEAAFAAMLETQKICVKEKFGSAFESLLSESIARLSSDQMKVLSECTISQTLPSIE